MKKIVAFVFCLFLVLNLSIPCLATRGEEIIYSAQTELENGIICLDMITVSSSLLRSQDKTATRSQTFLRDGTTIAEISITGTFRYDGSTISVVSKSISKCQTYDGWKFTQSSFTSSGGTITLTGTLSKLLLKTNVNISLSCDKDGNIS